MRRDLVQGVEFSHKIFKEHIATGAVVIDATCGNGQDTVFLARLVGETGKVLAFDIQQEAINRTAARLKDDGLTGRVKLINDGHQHLSDYVSCPFDGILFNLGYLPGGDKKVKTAPGTTIKALESGLQLLKKGGLVVLVIYTAHEGGAEELAALLEYSVALDEKEYNVARYHFINQQRIPPQVLVIKRRNG